MEGVMAVVSIVAYDFAPKYWASCNGQLMPIAQNQALFSLLGTTYGGNGINTFALPDLRSRTQVGTGTGAGLSNYTLGELSGTENCTLNVLNLPPHAHNGNITITPKAGNSQDDLTPTSNFPGVIPNGYAATPTASTVMQGPNIISTTIGAAGAGQPFPLSAPYTVLNYIICLNGLFPSRN